MNDDVRTRLRGLERRMNELEVRPVVAVKRLHKDAVIPEYQTLGAAGMDLVACNDEPIVIQGEPTLIPTGLAIALPSGYEAQIRPRSGLSLKGVTIANSPGTIDEDYRGEIKVIVSTNGRLFTIKKGDRIAQMVISRVVQAGMVEADDDLSETERGTGGFGSTGISK